MNTNQGNKLPNMTRRAIVLGATTMVITPASALSVLLALIAAPVAAGLIGYIGNREQLKASARQHQDLLEHQRVTLELERDRLRQQVASETTQMRLREYEMRMNVLLAAMNHSQYEKLAQVQIQGILTQQHQAFDVHHQPASALLAENIDRCGTRLGLSDGVLAIERARTAARVNNQNALDMGSRAREAGEPVPVPVSGRLFDADARLSAMLREKFAREQGLHPQRVERDYTLAAVQAFSRARTPRAGGPDVYTAAFTPRNGDETQYTYLYDRQVG